MAASSELGLWPATDQDTLDGWIDARRRAGYRTVFERNGWILLQRQIGVSYWRPASGGVRRDSYGPWTANTAPSSRLSSMTKTR